MKIHYLSIGIFCFLTIFTITNAQPIPDKKSYCEVEKKIYAAYEEKNFVYIKSICSKNKNDAFIFPACQLLLFLAGKLPPKEFIDAFPKNKDEYYLFATRAWGCETVPPKIFLAKTDEEDPMFIYYEELFKLMAKDDRRAMKKVLNSVPWVDGDMAENLLWDELPKFILKHSDIVLKNWDLFKDRLDLVDSDVYSEDVYQDLIRLKKIVQGTRANNVSKTEFLKYIDKEIEKHKTNKS